MSTLDFIDIVSSNPRKPNRRRFKESSRGIPIRPVNPALGLPDTVSPWLDGRMTSLRDYSNLHFHDNTFWTTSPQINQTPENPWSTFSQFLRLTTYYPLRRNVNTFCILPYSMTMQLEPQKLQSVWTTIIEDPQFILPWRACRRFTE